MDHDMLSASVSGNATTMQPPAVHANTNLDARPRKKKAQTLRESDWEPYRNKIIELHITRKLPLPKVKALIEEEFGFTAE
jgi:hypothetical protein